MLARVCARLPRRDHVTYSGLTLNRKGVERALDAGLTCVVISHSASDTHSRKNTRKSFDDAARETRELVRFARAHGVQVRAGIQCAFGCRSEGAIDVDQVLTSLDHLLDAGADANKADKYEAIIGAMFLELKNLDEVWRKVRKHFETPMLYLKYAVEVVL